MLYFLKMFVNFQQLYQKLKKNSKNEMFDIPTTYTIFGMGNLSYNCW